MNMKKLFLAVCTACIASLSQAGVEAKDPNGDGNLSVFLDAAHGLYWTTGIGLFNAQTQSDARTTVSSASFEGLTTWRLPTVEEFQNLYATQGTVNNEPNGRMIYGLGTINFDHYGYWTSENLTGFAVNSGTTVPYSLATLGSVIAVSPVPEPETYAMLLAGLGLIGLTKRRKKV
jgi:hypothetical protein